MGEIFRKKPLRKTLASVYEDINKTIDNIEAGALVIEDESITKTKLAVAVQASLDLADTALQGSAAITAIRAAKIQLNGINPSPVNFQDADVATLLSSNAGPYDFTGVGDGGTIIVNPDGDGNKTIVFNFTAATSVSAASPSTDISGGTDNKFNISVDGDEAEEVALTVAGKNSGELIAAEMESKIQALGGSKAGVTVDYNVTNAGKYTIKSSTLGTGSSVVITAATSGSVTEELKISQAEGGVETPGTGDVIDASAVTAQEIADVINADAGTFLSAEEEEDKVRLSSDSTGRLSKLVMGNGTLNTVVGFTNAQTDTGAQGLGYDTDMADANYIAVVSLDGTAQASLASKNVSITNKSASGFTIECETAGATDYVDVIIVGEAA